MEIVSSFPNKIQFGASEPPFVLFLSESGQAAYASQVKLIRPQHKDALVAALMAIDFAFQAGRISNNEKERLQEQLRLGKGCETVLLQKLSTVEIQALKQMDLCNEDIVTNSAERLEEPKIFSDNETFALDFRSCVVCLQTFPAEKGLSCRQDSDSHFVCQDDLNTHVQASSTQTDIDKLRKRKGKVFCPVNSLYCDPSDWSCRSAPYSDIAIAKLVSEETFSAYLGGLQRVLEDEHFEKSQETIHQEVQRLLLDIREGKVIFTHELLREELRKLLANPRQCGSCGYGPVEPFGCTSLSAHQGEPVDNALTGNSTEINNSCPNCNWFAEDLSEWPVWNGKLSAAFMEANPTMIIPVPLDSELGAQDDLPSGEVPPGFRTRLCKHFARGRCRYGRQCFFAHREANLRPTVRPAREVAAVPAAEAAGEGDSVQIATAAYESLFTAAAGATVL